MGSLRSAGVAQWSEQGTHNPWVEGSIPSVGTGGRGSGTSPGAGPAGHPRLGSLRPAHGHLGATRRYDAWETASDRSSRSTSSSLPTALGTPLVWRRGVCRRLRACRPDPRSPRGHRRQPADDHERHGDHRRERCRTVAGMIVCDRLRHCPDRRIGVLLCDRTVPVVR
jgi:hypothetical protein